jgi:hypothetical protein
MPKYRKKPVVINAEKVSVLLKNVAHAWGENPLWFIVAYDQGLLVLASDYILIKTLEGTMKGDIDDYIIQGVSNDLYPCKPDIFKNTYEPVTSVESAKFITLDHSGNIKTIEEIKNERRPRH